MDVQSALFDQVRTCDNHCSFCFIYQLPPGLRKSLYLKDDDYRLSFLYGNFTTLTRFTEADLERVVTERLSPLNVSIHATDPDVRSEMLRNRRGATSLRWLRALLDHDIEVHGQVVVCPDVSGLMSSPVTGHRGSATSAVRCIDVAALVAAAFCAKNPHAQVLPFEQSVVRVELNPRDSVMTNAARLAAIGGGGTNVSAPLALLNKQHAPVDLVVIVSDNESWVDARRHGGTETMRQWAGIKARCPQARLVCIDIQPNGTTQAAERADVMNVGGFSDAVFSAVAQFAGGTLDANHWVGEIEKIALDAQ